MDHKAKIALLAAISTFMLLAGLTCADEIDPYPIKSTYTGYTYSMDQKVQGNGFFSTYQNIDVSSLGLNNSAHGSGSYDVDTKIDSRKGVKFDEKIDDFKSASDRGTTFIESADFTYAPSSMKLGKYSLPIIFKSKGMEDTCLKNYVSGVSMNAKFSYADTLSKNISAELYWKNSVSSGEFEATLDSETRTRLNLEAAFSGKGHVGVLNLDKSTGYSDIMMDEDYSGTFYITKNLSHNAVINKKVEKDDWLPCCSGGFADMNYLDRKPFKSATGVFDCSCFKTPTEAQFKRVYS
ncbi:Uncharacterised protein [uncultured archaeon]|nr:Uncharacterised protein [uncultured archaeon]